MNLEPLRELERKWRDVVALRPGTFTSDAYAECADDLSRAIAQLDEGWQKDAERYRWLRDKSPRTYERGKTGVFIACGSVYSGFGQPYREDLDAVVDHAMAGGNPHELLKKLGDKRAMS